MFYITWNKLKTKCFNLCLYSTDKGKVNYTNKNPILLQDVGTIISGRVHQNIVKIWHP